MRQAHVLLAMMVAVGLVVSGCGGSGNESQPPLEAAEWADGFCISVAKWEAAHEQLQKRFQASPSLTSQRLDQAVTTVRDVTQVFTDNLAFLGAPAIDSGQEATRLVAGLVATLDDDVGGIESAAEGVSGQAELEAAAASIRSILSSMGTAVSDAVQAIQEVDTTGKLKGAFAASASCRRLASR